MPSRFLVVHYSRSGTTRRLAAAIAERLHCDTEEIRDRDPRKGLSGYIRSVFDSLRKRPADIETPMRDAGAYDLVIIGTPVWAGSMSAPVRSYLLVNKDRLHQVAFFCTLGGSGATSTFARMADLLERQPVAGVFATAVDMKSDTYLAMARQFAKEIEIAAATPGRRKAA
jgi:flavodoxin